LYCNTNLGAVASLRTADGRIEWLCRYPRGEYVVGDPDRANRNLYRDLNPCLLNRGNLIVAPSDCDRLFSLDANSGELLWSTDGDRATDAVHLLGVSDECLIASGDYLYWLDALSGRILCQFPPANPEAPGFPLASPRGYGRGLLVGAEIWFPVRNAILVFRQQPRRVPMPGQSRLPPRFTPELVRRVDWIVPDAESGNLVMADDVLVVAGATQIRAHDVRVPGGSVP
jgi:hypothetical protein